MITLEQLHARFPEYSDLTQPRFDIFLGDAVIEMGEEPSRWLGENSYNKAQACLIAHFLVIAEATELGDANPNAPLERTEVDGVEVEFATAKWSGQKTIDSLQSTSYGQEYVRLRRMAFAGAHMAYQPIG